MKFIQKILHSPYVLIYIVDVMLLGVLAQAALNVSFLNPISRAFKSYSSSDIYYQVMLTGDKDTSDVITLVDMNDLYERAEIGSLIMELRDMEPAVLGLDLSFEGLKDDPVGSAVLAEAALETPQGVYAMKLEDYNAETNHFDRIIHSFFAEGMDVHEGYANINSSQDGSVERDVTLAYEVDGKKYYCLSAAIARQFMGDNAVDYKIGEKSTIDYIPTTFRVVRYDSLQYHPEWITGKVVLLGGVSNRNDVHYTPVGRIPGIEMWAYSVKTLLEAQPVKQLTGIAYYIYVFILSFLLVSLFLKYSFSVEKMKDSITKYLLQMTFVISVILFVVVAILFGIGYWAFNQGYDLRLGLPITIFAFASIAKSFYGLFVRIHNRIKEIKNHKTR